MSVVSSIDHETGDLSQYVSTVTDGGDLGVGAPGLADTGFKMEATIDDASTMYGLDDLTITDQVHLRWRFYFDFNGMTMGNNETFQIFTIRRESAPFHFAIVNIKTGGAGALFYEVNYIDDSGGAGSFQASLTDEQHFIEIHIEKASTDSASDGRIRVWFDRALVDTLSNVDTFDVWAGTHHPRLGPDGLDAGTSGVLLLDQLEVNDDGSEIGPHIPITMIGPQMMMGVGT